MIRKARNEFILTAMLAMTFCVVLLIGTINLINYRQVNAQLNMIFEEMCSTDKGKIDSDIGDHKMQDDIPKMENPNQTMGQPFENQKEKDARNKMHPVSRLYKSRYYKIVVPKDEEGQIFISEENLSADDAMELVSQIDEAYAKGKNLKDYKYQVQDLEEETLYFVLDCSSEYGAIRSLLFTSIVIGLGSLLVILVFIYYMSGKVVAPLQESMDKQKQFITDASHELKTPVSVISTNMEILKMDLGTENEWVSSTQRQIVKLRKLISHLISLAKLEETENEVERMEFSFSDAVQDCVDVYAAMAEADGKKLTTDITPDLKICAEEKSIREMLTILFENAVKYATDDSEIHISLKKEGKKLVFITENDWAHDVDASELDRLFERFYRGDKSRNRDQKNSGYGLGLSIARNAAQRNKGKIMVSENKEKHLVFKVVF